VKIVVDSSNIDKLFALGKNKRKIREGVVDQLRGSLNTGEHFDSGIVVNKKDGKFHLIDGNHRYLAMKTYFEKHPKEKIELNLIYYEDLTPEQEKEIYTKWNMGTKQNKNDFLQQYIDDIKIFKMMQGDFPCKVTVYPTKEGVGLSRVLEAYHMATSKTSAFYGTMGGMDSVNFAKRLGETDFQYMYAYFAIHQAAFGSCENNAYVSGSVLPALMRLWWDNKLRFRPKKIVYYYRTRLFNKPRLLYWSRQHGRESREEAYLELKAIINKGFKQGKFL
jgi:hypothetical protein